MTPGDGRAPARHHRQHETVYFRCRAVYWDSGSLDVHCRTQFVEVYINLHAVQ
jgi:hypothetical protein